MFPIKFVSVIPVWGWMFPQPWAVLFVGTWATMLREINANS